MNKKGLFFTTLAIVLVSIVIITFVATTQNRTQDIIEINNIRVETAGSFVNFLEETQFKRALETSTNYALASFSNYIEDNKNYLPEGNAKYALAEAVFGIPCDTKPDYLEKTLKEMLISSGETGTCISPSPYSSYMITQGLSDQTLPGILDSIKSLASDSGLKFNYFIKDVKFRLKDSWTIEAELTLDYNLNNIDGTIQFKKQNLNIKTDVTIISQRDSLYTKEGYIKFIKKENDQSLNEVLPWRFIKNPDKSPDYFQRLIGQLDKTSEFGIQSVFNPSAYAPMSGSLGSKSFIDFSYLSPNGKLANKCKIFNNIYIKLIDPEDMNFYSSNGVNFQDCGDGFVDCSDPNAHWKNADPLNCGVTCTGAKPLLMIRYCGRQDSPTIETKCEEDVKGKNPASACDNNCKDKDGDNKHHCGDGILNKLCEDCEPAPGVSCNPATCKFY